MNITAVIIEDECKIREVFKQLLKEFCPTIILLGEADNISDGYTLILKNKPEVVFLDIEMPGGCGFELLSKFDIIPFETVFVSSYGHYAIRALKMSALDYLLKPVLIEDIIALPAKLQEAINLKQNAAKYILLKNNLTSTEREKKLAVSSKKNLELVNISDIKYLHGEGNYTTIFLNDEKKLLVSKTLKEYESILCSPINDFIRIHKATILNISHIKSLVSGEETYAILNDGKKLEVSRRKKGELMERLRSHPFNS
ncbi:MAG: LytTR family DNA-binding domain-containing protein [Bacteroidia bacterium]